MFASWQVRPPSNPTSLESTFLNNGGTVLEATYSVTDITLGPTGNLIVSGAERSARASTAPGTASTVPSSSVLLEALFEDDPVLEHGSSGSSRSKDFSCRPGESRNCTRLEACWTVWDTSGSVASVSATAGGSLYFTTHDNLYAASSTRSTCRSSFSRGPSTALLRGGSRRVVEVTFSGRPGRWPRDMLPSEARAPATADLRALALRSAQSSGLQEDGSVQFSLACTIGRCKGTWTWFSTRTAAAVAVRSRRIRRVGSTSTGGKVIVVRFPYRQTKKASPIGVRVVARVNGRLARTIDPASRPRVDAALSLTCAAGTRAGVAFVSGIGRPLRARPRFPGRSSLVGAIPASPA